LLDTKAVAHLLKLLGAGKSQAVCATVLGVSVRAIGRGVARAKRDEN